MAFFPMGDTMLELICHNRRISARMRSSMIRNYKGTINHLCFEVNDLEAAIGVFQKNGAKLAEGCPTSGAHGRVAFFHPDTTEGILIELCEV